MPLLIGAAIVSSMVTLPSSAHTNPVKAVPGQGEVVRAVDPTQSKPNPAGPGVACTDFGWGAASGTGNFENPCAVWFQIDQPMDSKKSSLAVYGPNDDGNAVAGTVAFRDSTPASTARSQVATAVPGADTVIFFPNAALPAGTYLAKALITDDSRLGGHGPNCDETVEPVRNCFEWRFTVAPTPATPVITSPVDSDALGTRQVEVSGTAEPHSQVEILDADDKVLATTTTNAQGAFAAVVDAADGANTVTARATSALTTTSERKWASYAACRDAAIHTGEDEDLDALILEEECGAAPAEVLPPVVSSSAVSFTATVATDTEAPTITLLTPPDTVQLGEEEALITGTAADNDQIETLSVVVTDALSNAVTTYTVTFDKEPTTDWSVSLHDPGYFTVSITAIDRAGNASNTITTTYLSTTGNALAE